MNAHPEIRNSGHPDHISPNARSALLGRLLFAASLPVSAIALMSGLAPWSWIGELCLHLSWQAALALLPIIIVIRRERVRVSFLLLAMIVGFWPWVRASYEPRLPEPSGILIHLATGNLFDFNAQRAQTLAAVLDLDVDLLCLQEVLPADEEILSAHWRYAIWNHDRELLTSVLLSRFPITWSHIHDLDQFALVEALVQTPRAALRVFVVHLASPKRPLKAERRDQQLHQLAALVRASPEPVIVAGDFNLCSAAAQWRRFIAEADVQRPPGPGPSTWPAWLGPFGIDLDHMAGRRVAISPLQSIDLPGSDHRGLITTFSLSSSLPSALP